MNEPLEWVLLGFATVAIAVVICAAVIAVHEINASKTLMDQVGSSAETATNKVSTILDGGGDERVLAAKLTGATEYLHALPVVGEVRSPSGIPSAAMVLLGVLILAGVALAVVDRVEGRREVTACLQALRAAPGAAGTTVTTSAVQEPPAEGEAEAPVTTTETGRTAPPTASTTGGVTTSRTGPQDPDISTTSSTVASASSSGAAAFFEACMQTLRGEESKRGLAGTGPTTSSTSSTSSTSTSTSSTTSTSMIAPPSGG